jgi:hypothetical protein
MLERSASLHALNRLALFKTTSSCPGRRRRGPLIVDVAVQKHRDKEAHEATGDYCEHGVWRCRWVASSAAGAAGG